jgi:hypothetical protein
MVCQIKVREKREKREKPPSDVPDCRSFADLGCFCREISTGGLRQGELCFAYTWSWSHIWIGGSYSWNLHRLRIYETSGVAFELSKLLNQENALSVPCLKHFHNYWWPIKLATCGFPGEKTSYFETIVVPNICRKLISHLGKELLYRVDLANKCNRFPERAKIVAYQVTVRGHFREMSSPVSRIFY